MGVQEMLVQSAEPQGHTPAHAPLTPLTPHTQVSESCAFVFTSFASLDGAVSSNGTESA